MSLARFLRSMAASTCPDLDRSDRDFEDCEKPVRGTHGTTLPGIYVLQCRAMDCILPDPRTGLLIPARSNQPNCRNPGLLAPEQERPRGALLLCIFLGF